MTNEAYMVKLAGKGGLLMCVEGSMFHFLPNSRLMDEDSTGLANVSLVNLSDSRKGWDKTTNH